MPGGVGNAYTFQVFNSITATLVMGTPMVLYFQCLGATATVLGILAALPPLLVIFNIPAASFVERVGYRAFMLRGWTARSLLIAVMAAVAALPLRFGPGTRMALMLFVLFLFNTARGISQSGWLPWITQMIPESMRGRYLSREGLSVAGAGLATMIGSAAFLHAGFGDAAFACLFAGGFVTAMVSLEFLRRMPDVPTTPPAAGAGRVPWKEMMLYPPFLKLMIFDVVVCVALAGGGVFWVPLLRDGHGWSESGILSLSAWTSAVAVAVPLGTGRLMDRVGSRPLLGISVAVLAIQFLLWGAVAAHWLAAGTAVLVLLSCLSGLGGTLFNLANTRLVMATVPATGRSHFFALFSVLTSLALGILPIGWGLLLDSLAHWRGHWGRWEWNQYSLLFAALALTMIAAHFCWRRLREPQAMSTEMFLQELLVKTPARALTRLLVRRPY